MLLSSCIAVATQIAHTGAAVSLHHPRLCWLLWRLCSGEVGGWFLDPAAAADALLIGAYFMLSACSEHLYFSDGLLNQCTRRPRKSI